MFLLNLFIAFLCVWIRGKINARLLRVRWSIVLRSFDLVTCLWLLKVTGNENLLYNGLSLHHLSPRATDLFSWNIIGYALTRKITNFQLCRVKSKSWWPLAFIRKRNFTHWPAITICPPFVTRFTFFSPLFLKWCICFFFYNLFPRK